MELQDTQVQSLSSPCTTTNYKLSELICEESVLKDIYTKMKDQLQKLEIEELELKQKIRRKEMNEAASILESADSLKLDPTALLPTNDHLGNQQAESFLSQILPYAPADDSQMHDIIESERQTNLHTHYNTKPLSLPSFDDPVQTNMMEINLSALNSLPLDLFSKQKQYDIVESEDEID